MTEEMTFQRFIGLEESIQRARGFLDCLDIVVDHMNKQSEALPGSFWEEFQLQSSEMRKLSEINTPSWLSIAEDGLSPSDETIAVTLYIEPPDYRDPRIAYDRVPELIEDAVIGLERSGCIVAAVETKYLGQRYTEKNDG